MKSLLIGTLLFGLVPFCFAEATFPDPERFRNAIDRFIDEDQQLEPDPSRYIATGSSSMLYWRNSIANDLAPLAILPRGFGGSNMNDVLHFLDDLVLKHQPRAVLLYEGDNDAALGASADQVTKLLNRILERIRSESPDTNVYLLYVKPSPSRWSIWPLMQEMNRAFQSICDRDADVTCIDIATPMLDADGQPKEEIFLDDKLHMNAAGYAIWKTAVRAVLFPTEKE